jgi:nucleotide-binding universal stress UspA family protein
MAPSQVLVPIDGSPLADEALVHALETFECPVTVLNVVTPLDAGMSEGDIVGTDEDRMASAREHAETVVDSAARRAASLDRDVETAVETGDPADAILAYVEDHAVDHVVMGGHGGPESGLVDRLLGTVATAVVARAPVTVTVVR